MKLSETKQKLTKQNNWNETRKKKLNQTKTDKFKRNQTKRNLVKSGENKWDRMEWVGTKEQTKLNQKTSIPDETKQNLKNLTNLKVTKANETGQNQMKPTKVNETLQNQTKGL